MAISYDSHSPNIETDGGVFSDMRDSLYILSCINQFTMEPGALSDPETQGLFRIALFSRNLDLPENGMTLIEKRRQLAQILRGSRRKGVVLIFLSMMWFLFSLVISIQYGKQKHAY